MGNCSNSLHDSCDFVENTEIKIKRIETRLKYFLTKKSKLEKEIAKMISELNSIKNI